jgi:hypothetical protein
MPRGARPELQVDRLIAREQRQVAVRCRARDDLDVAGPLKVGERPGDIAADPAVHLPHALEELLPEVREAYDLLLAGTDEVLARFDAGPPGSVVVKRKFLLKFGRGKLFGQHRRQVDRPFGRDPVGDQTVGRLEQGQVTLEGGLTEPVAAVGPAAVIDDHWEMRVEHEGKR